MTILIHYHPQYLQNTEVPEVPSPVDELDIQDQTIATSTSLARDYIYYKLEDQPPFTKPRTDAARTLRRVGDEMIDRHQTVVNAISKRLRYSDLQNDPKFKGYTLDERMFIMIADEISKDHQDNWGRVVSLFVLGAILAQNNHNEQHGRDIERIIDTVGKYVGNHKRIWIEKNGGWVRMHSYSCFPTFFQHCYPPQPLADDARCRSQAQANRYGDSGLNMLKIYVQLTTDLAAHMLGRESLLLSLVTCSPPGCRCHNRWHFPTQVG